MSAPQWAMLAWLLVLHHVGFYRRIDDFKAAPMTSLVWGIVRLTPPAVILHWGGFW